MPIEPEPSEDEKNHAEALESGRLGDTGNPEQQQVASRNIRPRARVLRLVVPPREKRKWDPPKSTVSNKMLWRVFVMAMFMVILLFTVLTKLSNQATVHAQPILAAEFKHVKDNYSIRVPLNWGILDREPDVSLHTVPKSPRNGSKFQSSEYGYGPHIMVSRDDLASGRFKPYLLEHKARIENLDKTVKWLSEDEDCIDGCHTARLVYEWDFTKEEDHSIVRVRTLQYVLDDRHDEIPRYFVISCSVGAAAYDKLLPTFEATSRSFHRTAPAQAQPALAP